MWLKEQPKVTIELSDYEFRELIHALAMAASVTVRELDYADFNALVLRSVNVVQRSAGVKDELEQQ